MITTSSWVVGVPFWIDGGSCGLLKTINVHFLTPSDMIACSVYNEILVILLCLNRMINAKISKLPDIRVRQILDVISNNVLFPSASDHFEYRAVTEAVLNFTRKYVLSYFAVTAARHSSD